MQIANLQNQATSDQFTIASLQNQVASANTQISNLTSTVTTLQNQIDNLKTIISTNNSQLETLVFHVCEKGENYTWGHLPDANATYNQILALNNDKYDVLLLPEFEGNKNWTAELEWLEANFGGQEGIPIMLDVFGGGDGTTPIPKLSTDEILAVMATCNVKYLRFSEVVSWHIENPQPFPTDYVQSILEFCKTNNLKLFWTEWKIETFNAVQTSITGYEDIVTVSFSTNSQYVEPADGFMQVNQMFPNWGASVQAWYWETRTNTTLLNMPPHS